MVQMNFDRLHSQRQRSRRNFLKPPLEVRLANWLERVARNSAQFGRPLQLQLRAKYAAELGLPDSWVVLNEDGLLIHATRAEPLASLSSHS